MVVDDKKEGPRFYLNVTHQSEKDGSMHSLIQLCAPFCIFWTKEELEKTTGPEEFADAMAGKLARQITNMFMKDLVKK